MIWVSVRQRELGSDVLALISIVATSLTSQWLAAALIAVMLTTGQALESWASGRARSQLEALAKRAPRNIQLFASDGSLSEKPIESAKVGDRFMVRTGEVVALDGISETDGSFDESALTGEPIPRERLAGEEIASGVVNAAAPIVLVATTDSKTSTYSALVQLVEQVKTRNSAGVRLANKWALWFVPLSLFFATATWLVTGEIEPAISVLVAATPCPLILAVPIAIIAGISNATKHGAIIKDGAALEQLSRASVLLVDKTGTLTHGGPQVTFVQVAPGLSADRVLQLAASVEQASSHVLAKAVVAGAKTRGLELLPIEGANEVLGEGLEASVGQDVVRVGRMPSSLEAWAVVKASLQIAVELNGVLIGVIDLEDPIRPDAAQTISRLRSFGVARILLVTGDREPAARLIASAVGVDEVYAECRPQQKLELVNQEIAKNAGVVLVVGDGINDAPALAAANVGVAMGARGATAASESADVVLIEDSISRLADTIGVAKGAVARALQAAAAGMGLSLMAMTLGAFGILSPTQNALFQEIIDAVAILWALIPASSSALKR
jgi:heavy metal translocating P-type ATPase